MAQQREAIVNDRRYTILAIAATVSVAASMPATASMAPAPGVAQTVARPTLVRDTNNKQETEISNRGGVKSAPGTSQPATVKPTGAPPGDGNAGRSKTDKR